MRKKQSNKRFEKIIPHSALTNCTQFYLRVGSALYDIGMSVWLTICVKHKSRNVLLSLFSAADLLQECVEQSAVRNRPVETEKKDYDTNIFCIT